MRIKYIEELGVENGENLRNIYLSRKIIAKKLCEFKKFE